MISSIETNSRLKSFAEAANIIPASANKYQRVKFGDAGFDPVREFHRHHQHDDGRQQKKALEKERQPVEHIHAVERGRRVPAAKLETAEQDQAQPTAASLAELPLFRRRRPQIRQQNAQPERPQRRFPE